METSEEVKEEEAFPEPRIKERDQGIIEAFAKETHHVLTTTQIAEHVDLSPRQVRRRLDELAEEKVVGTRVVSGVKLAWLEADVKEPITVQYPLLGYVRDHASLQMFIIGVAIGIVSILILLAAALSIGYDVDIPYTSQEEMLAYGAIIAAGAGITMLMGLAMALVGKLMRWAGLDPNLKSV